MPKSDLKQKPTYPNIIIKGSQFDHKKIIKSDPYFVPNFMIVFRLAPQDYHHFYMPSTGKLLNYYYMGDDYQSVGYDFMYSTRFNPLNDNFRLVLEFEHMNSKSDSKSYSSKPDKFYLVIIGATTVGSIIIQPDLKIGQIYMSKQHLGYFDLGGSCVVFLTNKNIILRPDLISNSANNIETYFSVFDQITNLNNSNNLHNLHNSNNYQIPSIGYKYLNLHHNMAKKRKDAINKSKLIEILLIMMILVMILRRF
jgi:hypothetical protein